MPGKEKKEKAEKAGKKDKPVDPEAEKKKAAAMAKKAADKEKEAAKAAKKGQAKGKLAGKSDKDLAKELDTMLAAGGGFTALGVAFHKANGVSWKKGFKNTKGSLPKFMYNNSKAFQTAYKEGGKKGQDMLGISEMGGCNFFHIAVDAPDGDWALLDCCLAGANKKIDPNEEEKKGGAGDLGKIFFSAGKVKLIAVAHVPKELGVTKNFTANEWVKIVTAAYPNTSVLVNTGEIVKFEIPANTAANIFPMNFRDDLISTGVKTLVSRGLLPADDSDSGSFILGEGMD